MTANATQRDVISKNKNKATKDPIDSDVWMFDPQGMTLLRGVALLEGVCHC